jgi:leucine dehydrogenase
MLSIKELKIAGYQKVIEAVDPISHLHAFIAIHDLTLGPALGGTRIHSYDSREEALNDALRLSKAMTYKSAIAETGLGGGKSVIMANPETEKNEKLLFAFAQVIDFLQGEYIAAEDVGSSIQDMGILKMKTPYVAALATKKSSGDPSRYTAWGVFRGIQAIAKQLWGNTSVKNKKIAISGLGNVGSKLANILFWEGADLILSDINVKKVQEEAHLHGAQMVDPADFCYTPCDILAPCALGGLITEANVSQLQCLAIGGGANNQLLESSCGQLLMESGILYAPDYIINAGGVINAAAEFSSGGYNPKQTLTKVDHIYEILLNVFEKSRNEYKSTTQVADEIAEYNIKNRIGRRTESISFTNL